MKHTLATLVLAFLLIGCYTVSLPEKMPEDFNITYIGELGDSYDSKKEEFTRKYYSPDSIIIRSKLSQFEKEKIYKAVKENWFLDLSEWVDDVPFFNRNKNIGQKSIIVFWGDKKKKVVVIFVAGERVRRFSPVEDVIREVLYHKKEIKELPDNGWRYE